MYCLTDFASYIAKKCFTLHFYSHFFSLSYATYFEQIGQRRKKNIQKIDPHFNQIFLFSFSHRPEAGFLKLDLELGTNFM